MLTPPGRGARKVRGRGGRRRRRVPLLLATLVAAAAVGGWWWWTHHDSGSDAGAPASTRFVVAQGVLAP